MVQEFGSLPEGLKQLTSALGVGIASTRELPASSRRQERNPTATPISCSVCLNVEAEDHPLRQAMSMREAMGKDVEKDLLY